MPTVKRFERVDVLIAVSCSEWLSDWGGNWMQSEELLGYTLKNRAMKGERWFSLQLTVRIQGPGKFIIISNCSMLVELAIHVWDSL